MNLPRDWKDGTNNIKRLDHDLHDFGANCMGGGIYGKDRETPSCAT